VTSRTLQLTDRLHAYLLANSLRETPVQRRLRAATRRLARASMQIGPEQGMFMQLLVKLMRAKRIVEVGTFTGYSSLAMALALPPGGRIVCCDVSEAWTAIARRHWKLAGVEKKISLRIAPALETLDSLLGKGGAGRYDFAFIDADKPNYANYYERCLRLVRRGGLIAADNTLWGGSVADPRDNDEDTRAIRAFNRKLHRDRRIELSLLPIGDGLTLALKR
jgi:predicted O-methyltransferase YrrM